MNSLLSIQKEKLQSMQIVDWGYIEESKPSTFKFFDKWIKNKLNGPLGYMADHRKDIRSDIKNFFPEFQSSLVFLFDYTPAAKLNKENDDHRFAAYTKGFDGIDYHYWIKDKLESVALSLGLENYKLSIDAQPVLERDMAAKAGLGWFGKNSMLINKKHGSFFLISSILIDTKLDLNKAEIEIDHCGNCTKCIDACPTSAIIDNKIIDADKCISTFTIELFKDAEAPKGYPTDTGEIFGCDICQDVCPWNIKPLNRSDVMESPEYLKTYEETDLETISNRQFKRIFKGTSLERTGRVGLLKNLKKKSD